MKPLRLLLALLMLVTAVMPSLAMACARGCELAEVVQVEPMADHCATAAATPSAPADAGDPHWLEQGPLCQLAVGVTLNSLPTTVTHPALPVYSLSPLPVFPLPPDQPPYRPPIA